ncbi:MAG: TIGR03067 domain-containing protein [Isosphaeraceae bacterium]
MRIALATLLCTLVLTASGGTGARADDNEDVKQELKKFQGTWTFESIETGGKEIPAAEFKGITVTFEGDKYAVKKGDEVIEAATQKLDPSKSPKTLDATVTEGPNQGAVILGIYEISGDTLKVCFDPEGKKRPMQFKTASGSQTLVVHKRVKR